IATSKSMKPPSTRATRSSAPTTSAPAALAASAASPAANTAPRAGLPRPAGGLGPLVRPGRLTDQHGRRGRLQHEGEGTVLVDRDLGRDDLPDPVLGRGVVLLAELHGLDPVGAQSGADRRRRGGFARGQLNPDDGDDAPFGHVVMTPLTASR